MLSKRLIACLDVRDGKLAKSIKFVDTKDIGDPVEKAREYYLDGLDELVFYDITASPQQRSVDHAFVAARDADGHRLGLMLDRVDRPGQLAYGAGEHVQDLAGELGGRSRLEGRRDAAQADDLHAGRVLHRAQ